MQKIQELPLFRKLDSRDCAACKMRDEVPQVLAS
jgi:hypothetical protein